MYVDLHFLLLNWLEESKLEDRKLNLVRTITIIQQGKEMRTC